MALIFDRKAKSAIIIFFADRSVEDDVIVEANVTIKICFDFTAFLERLPLNHRCVYKYKNGKDCLGIEFIFEKGLREGDMFMA